MRSKWIVVGILSGSLLLGAVASLAQNFPGQQNDLESLQQQLRETQILLINRYEQQGQLSPQEALDWKQKIVSAPDPALLTLPSPEGKSPLVKPSTDSPSPGTIAPGSAPGLKEGYGLERYPEQEPNWWQALLSFVTGRTWYGRNDRSPGGNGSFGSQGMMNGGGMMRGSSGFGFSGGFGRGGMMGGMGGF